MNRLVQILRTYASVASDAAFGFNYAAYSHFGDERESMIDDAGLALKLALKFADADVVSSSDGLLELED